MFRQAVYQHVRGADERRTVVQLACALRYKRDGTIICPFFVSRVKIHGFIGEAGGLLDAVVKLVVTHQLFDYKIAEIFGFHGLHGGIGGGLAHTIAAKGGLFSGFYID